MANALHDLAAAGVAVWLDDLSRTRIHSGSLARMVEAGEIVGITTNPTIFSKAIGSGSGYEDQLRDLALRGTSIGETLRLLTAWDVRAACDILRPVYDHSGGRDGRVSIEVDPRIAEDAERTAAEARGLWWLVDRPNLFIKIPATLAGLPAITETLAAGISVNVTLIFSVERYKAVQEAFLKGLEQRAAAGGSLHGIGSVASFFVSRVDTEVDRRLGQKTPHLHGQAAVANSRLAYEAYEQMLRTERWQALAAKGALPQRVLWASTGVKNPAYPDTKYVVDLVAKDTVNTMPEATLDAVKAHGQVRGDTIRDAYAAAHRTMEDLRKAGVDVADVAAVLEEQGVESFAKSWEELIASVTQQIEKMGGSVMPAGAVKPASGDGGQSRTPAAGAPRHSAQT
ncbi:transaldolase [Rhodopila globiformis]|uniref:Transaldolase n=1 Tax=Rhodopila globiformis TaxID=1071 RepID=A0A2S6MTK5_RHOGL|nr:transaldolase [Rhodopila globiformis]PPQ25719.1 transaldolase [Rhodopila globiformis]